MTVLYSDRTVPLSVNSSNTDLATGLNTAWDFTGLDASHADGVPWVSPGAATLTKTGTINLVTRNGLPGRSMDVVDTWYKLANCGSAGLQTETGDFTLAVLVSMPNTTPATNGVAGYLYELYGSGGPRIKLEIGDLSGTGSYVSLTVSSTKVVPTSAPYYLLPGRAYVIVVRRAGNSFSLHQYDLSTGTYKLQGTGTETTSFTSTNATDLYVGWATNAAADYVIHSIAHWTTALSDTIISTKLCPDFWSMNTNGAAASTISITSPTTGASIGSTATISGTSTGTAPTGVEVQFNGGAWTALSGFSYATGSWSGTVSGLTAGTGTLTARKANETATVSSDITGISVISDTIAITNVPANKLFQRNVGTNNANIALSGTYAGSVTSIEWRYGSGAWTALSSATISGGNWSGTATGVPTGSGALQVRFSNNTAVIGNVSNISVGDIWICGGQSNMQGRGAAANTYTSVGGLLAHCYTRAGTWTDLTDPYDSASSSLGSIIPLLATKCIAAGVPVAFIPCAIGGTAITDWQKGGGNYSSMTTRLTGAGGSARGLLWWQGESDVNNGMSTATYVGYLNQMINDFYADTGLKTFVWRTHEGGSGTAQAHLDIREAQTQVGTNNTHAVLGPDPWGIETTDVHFLTTVKLQAVADLAWPMLAVEFYNMRKLVIPLVDATNAAQANKRNLRYAVFDQTTPDALLAPIAKGGNVGLGAVTGSNGNITIPLPNTTLSSGGTASIIISDTDGNVATSHKAFFGPAVVS